MPIRDHTELMETVVKRAIEDNGLAAFQQYWDLNKQLIEGLPVRAFYLVAEEGYGNLAILTSGSIVDIEADNDDDSARYISATAVRSIARVHFRAGPVQTIPNSEDAKITLVLSMIGATGTGPYWIAETDSEAQHLTRFCAALMQVINEQGLI